VVLWGDRNGVMRETGLTRRRFLVAGAASVGAGIAAPGLTEARAAAREGTRGGRTSAGKQSVCDAGERAVPVKIQISAAEPVRAMRGGIGASFHTITTTLPGSERNGSSWSGSVWGAVPPAEDNEHWNELFHHAEWLGMNWCRVELEQRMYEPERRKFDWDNPEMRVLYRVLDWTESRGVDVFLQQQWGNVAWNAYPGNAEDPIRRLRSAPYSVPEYAFGIGELAEHLTKVKKYMCIRWVAIANEPGHDSFSWWQDSEMKSAPFTPALKAVREEFDRRGLTLSVSGPDRTDLPELRPEEVDFDAYIGAYDLHSYDAVFDSMGWGYNLTEAERRMRQWAEWAHAKNKPFFISEFGTMAYGRGHDDAGPACYQSGLKNASLVVRGINAGVDGFNRWSFANRGDLDGYWQLVRTWDIDGEKLYNTFSPQPNAYYQFAMLSRFLPKYADVLQTRVEAPHLEEDRKLVAAALRTTKGNLTVLVVNENHRAAEAQIELSGMPGALRLHRYAVTREDEDQCHVDLSPQRSMDVNGVLADHIEPMSIVAYSTYKLGSGDPGVIIE